MKRHRIITDPTDIKEVNFEDFFEEVYAKIKHDWQKPSIRKHEHKWAYHKSARFVSYRA